MATYAIGDLQGSFRSLQKLLANIDFDAGRDCLWFVGDLVNRGPESLECLRFVRNLGDRAITVLGNHDLHLLCVAAGATRMKKSDTLQPILDAADGKDLLDWLRHRPMLHVFGKHILVHAGLLPQWSANMAKSLAEEVESALRGPNHEGLFSAMYGNRPDRWDDRLSGFDRLRVIVNAMTRMRICTTDGKMEFSHKGEAADFPPGYLPWFDVPGRMSADSTVICGHWSALGLKIEPNLLSIDTGCLWGRALTAVRIEDRAIFQVSCAKLAGHAVFD